MSIISIINNIPDDVDYEVWPDASADATGSKRSYDRIWTVWLSRHRQRRRLRELDARLLADIGIDCDLARAEAAKPFWRA